jgi:UDP-3-O-[3-hydroxymyristoyl] glucosamine N-acyltransferase
VKIPSISLQQIYELLNLHAEPAPSTARRTFTHLSAYDDATPESIVFATDAASLANAVTSKAGVILAPLNVLPPDADQAQRLLQLKHPKHAFALIGRHFDSFTTPAIHPSAIVDPAAHIGRNCTIGPGTVIEPNATLGDHCILGANVTIHSTTTLGNNVFVQSGAVLGGLGFGYVRGEDGAYVRFPQQGTLVIEDDVEIGANTTIDRGALGETRIGAGTKIDNMVHIGHNCIIGKNVIIAAQVGISGSCIIDDGVIFAGQVGLGDHVHIGPGVVLGGQGGVFPGKHLTGPGQVFAGTPAEPLADYLKSLARIRRLK